MIERLLAAERALEAGQDEVAERLFAQVAAADPRNAIAVVGLARVALERGDQLATYLLARKALALDPDNPAASHLAMRMGEQLAMRGEALPATPAPGSEARRPAEGMVEPALAAAPDRPSAARAGPAERKTRRPGLLDRWRRRDR